MRREEEPWWQLLAVVRSKCGVLYAGAESARERGLVVVELDVRNMVMSIRIVLSVDFVAEGMHHSISLIGRTS